MSDRPLLPASAPSAVAIRNDRSTSQPVNMILVLTRDDAVGFALPFSATGSWRRAWTIRDPDRPDCRARAKPRWTTPGHAVFFCRGIAFGKMA